MRIDRVVRSGGGFTPARRNAFHVRQAMRDALVAIDAGALPGEQILLVNLSRASMVPKILHQTSFDACILRANLSVQSWGRDAAVRAGTDTGAAAAAQIRESGPPVTRGPQRGGRDGVRHEWSDGHQCGTCRAFPTMRYANHSRSKLFLREAGLSARRIRKLSDEGIRRSEGSGVIKAIRMIYFQVAGNIQGSPNTRLPMV